MNGQPARVLRRWSGRREFRCYGSVSKGTRIEYGTGFSRKASVSDAQYRDLLKHFFKKEVPIGTSHDDPQKGSLGEWLIKNVTQTGIASYVGPILCEEGLARKTGGRGDLVKFL